ncbi:hypothetical protein H7H78_19270 [Mycobacterium shinjukuense]|uniref:Membrane protein n=1 Tax=Mycobacterium shinjukuense TaxID=398694 RepID=A0A7I7MXM4_9MYCO|nr:DUF6779 domain-containing protein [Mycobacterium shinjukuense]MCV6987468.1 hypothetical protein [Mycobacterium shinjukuense]ORB65336.1 hypothetical protein BST45_15525 [Mycobacterium shinjukuense]BBX75909.1 membrane protein [Mycobacterium shinjukuense]
MTVLSRGARVRRGGRRPGWVLLTTLLVLAIGASCGLVFTSRVELLRLAVILALWAAVAGAFVSMLYRRQAEVEQARARDLKLVYDLQLDREISARREYELTVESQLRRELASELRAAAADEVAALRAELAALRTSLEILFDTDLQHRPALEPWEKERDAARVLADRAHDVAHSDALGRPRSRETPPADWVSSDRVTVVPRRAASRADDTSIIDVPEVGVPPGGGGPLASPRQPTPAGEQRRSSYDASPPSEPARVPRHRPPEPERSGWPPEAADGKWLPPGTPGSHWASDDVASEPTAQPSSRRRRARHASPEDRDDGPLGPVEPHYGGRRSRSRHSAEYLDHGVAGLRDSLGGSAGGAPGEHSPPPRLAPPPPPEPAPRHRSAEEGSHGLDRQGGGQTVADLMARLQVEPTGGGRRRRRGG